MKKNIVNILATTGISLLLLSVVALFFHASCIYLKTVFQAFCINIITHLGIMIIQKIELRNIFTEICNISNIDISHKEPNVAEIVDRDFAILKEQYRIRSTENFDLYYGLSNSK